MSNELPKTPTVLGTGPLADEVRRMIEADPDRYRPETWSIHPIGKCPCCGKKVFRAKVRETGFQEGYVSMDGRRVHPVIDHVDKDGAIASGIGCCCVPPNWGPKHKPKAKRKPGGKR